MAQAVTLRREKTTLINGKPIVVLPPKITNVVELSFTPAVCAHLLTRRSTLQCYTRAAWPLEVYVYTCSWRMHCALMSAG